MSIVERALQKAQQQGRGASASPDQAVDPSADPAGQRHAENEVRTAAERGHPVPQAPAADVSLHRPHAVEDAGSLTATDLKRIVEINVERLRDIGRLAPVNMAQQTEDEIRRIKWPLLNSITGQGGATPVRNNVILVTSAVPAEGKTFISLNLALSIVRDREMRVVLVDGDVARPGLTPSLELEGHPGLNDVLDDPGKDVSEVTYRTTVEGLFFVPAGKWHEHSPEFFAGTRMQQVIETLSRRVGNGVVVIDSPPLLATNEAQAVTRYAGQVLVVVRADQTEQRAVLDAIALVDKSASVRAVLNQVEPTLVSKYYGQYYYGYGQSYGSRYGRDSQSGKGES